MSASVLLTMNSCRVHSQHAENSTADKAKKKKNVNASELKLFCCAPICMYEIVSVC